MFFLAIRNGRADVRGPGSCQSARGRGNSSAQRKHGGNTVSFGFRNWLIFDLVGSVVLIIAMGTLHQGLLHPAIRENRIEAARKWAKVGTVLHIIAVGYSVLLYNSIIYGILYYFRDVLVSVTSSPYFVIFAFATALWFYRLRGRHPLFYGITEISVATAAIWLTINTENALSLKGLALLGGIYIIVRGLDNMDRGMPSWLRPAWERLFPKQQRVEGNVRLPADR